VWTWPKCLLFTGRVFPKYMCPVSGSQDATRRGYFRAEDLGFKRLVLNFSST